MSLKVPKGGHEYVTNYAGCPDNIIPRLLGGRRGKAMCRRGWGMLKYFKEKERGERGGGSGPMNQIHFSLL